MAPNTYETYWPLRMLREHGYYFYLKPITEYQPDGRVAVPGHGAMIMLGGYSYLGLNGHPAINRAAAEAVHRYGTGTHGVRLLAGTLDVHRQLEERIARFKQAEAAAAFSSGFIANVSAIASLVGRHD